MASFEIKGIRRLRVRVDGMVSKAPAAAATACAAGAEHLKAVMVTQFLSGQAIGVDEEDLKNKWTVRKISSPPSAVLGTGVPYAGAQEYGSKRLVTVPDHVRRKPFVFEGVSTTGYARMRKRSKTPIKWPAFTRARGEFQEGAEGGFIVKVKGYQKRLNLKPHRFLRGAIKRVEPELPKIMGAVFRRNLAK